METKYDPIVLSVAMNQYGYWVVIVSTRPGGWVASTIAQVGVTPAEAVAAALVTVGHIVG